MRSADTYRGDDYEERLLEASPAGAKSITVRNYIVCRWGDGRKRRFGVLNRGWKAC